MELTEANCLLLVLLSFGLLVRTDIDFLAGDIDLLKTYENSTRIFKSKQVGDVGPAKIPPESVPWLVKILNENETHLFTGALVTWEKVLTTCYVATNNQIKFVQAGFGSGKPQRRHIVTTIADSRCQTNTSTADEMRRYDVGMIIVPKPFTATNVTSSVVHFPTLNKRKYLDLTDQIVANGIRCRIFGWGVDDAMKMLYRTDEHSYYLDKISAVKDDVCWGMMMFSPNNYKGVLMALTITAVQSYLPTYCQKFVGIHEFICSERQGLDSNATGMMEGSPVMCGDDIYGIFPRQQHQHFTDMLENRTVSLWLRLDEFLQLFIVDDPQLNEFIANFGH